MTQLGPLREHSILGTERRPIWAFPHVPSVAETKLTVLTRQYIQINYSEQILLCRKNYCTISIDRSVTCHERL
jgi:hypothetical protein